MVDAGYEGRCAGDFLHMGARELTSELSTLNADDATEEHDDDLELPDLPIETACTFRSAASPEKGAPSEADEASDQMRRR